MKKFFIALVPLSLAIIGCILSFNFEKKSPAITETNGTLQFNNIEYIEIDESMFEEEYQLLPNERIDLETTIYESSKRYLPKNTYYIYEGDDVNSPLIIYKNNRLFGVSGWYFMKKEDDGKMPIIDCNAITEIFTDSNPKTWSTNNKTEIESIQSAITQRQNLVPIIASYTDCSWGVLYVRYENSPFVQEVGWQEKGDFQYRTQR